MKTPECQQLPLVEALRDGRLGPQEQASMERHLSVCATCTAFAHDLDRIGAAIRAPHEPVTPLQHQRARLGLLRRAAELSGGEQHAAPRRFPVFAFAAALSFAAAIGWASARIGAPEEQPLRALHQQLTPQLPALLQTSVHPAGGTRYERSTTAEVDTVTLTSGALDVNVRPLLPSERFVVKTTDAEVEVRGTSFHIVADQGRIKSVTVVEGQAEVRYAGFSAVIPAGGSWKSTGDEHASNDAAPKAPDPPKPAEPPAVEPPAIEPPSRPALAAAPAVRSGGPVAFRASSPVERDRASGHLSPKPAEPPAAPEPPAPQPSAAPKAAPTLSPASREFADAMSSLGSGDYLKSEKQLDTFAASHPGDPRADEADYLRAIALQRAGKQAAAAEAARRYLAGHPQGAHRIEAQAIAGK